MSMLIVLLLPLFHKSYVDGFCSIEASRRSLPKYNSPNRHRVGKVPKTVLFSSSYGRGAEIWPPANEEPVRLEQSFPNGILPDEVVQTFASLSSEGGATTPQSTSIDSKKQRRIYVPRAIGRILRRAAYAQEETESEGTTSSSMEKTPILVAAALVLSGMIRPLDALLVSFLTGYFVILFLWARSLRRDGVTPVMPSLPPQGHVPNLVSNPLGPGLTSFSWSYDFWLKTGALLGLAAPLAMMLRYALTDRLDCARACARPIFFMCCQAISEAASRRSLTPLPIRILIPVAYNTIRLGYLWSWVFQPLALGHLGQAVAIANLAYWATNLFGFLIPVATVRYMRAHFFAVEAEQVTTRASMEDSAGLMF
ncbi:expressed unknown protein [Seminavis robusta]|uniref:DUF7733 domain-containing protein n=1 Tax=Seminavis robusta TaxID=568900 RepID=A0A9N8E7G3_9STRA|nr:expressed unknown protein [Seminavis robusta]|eukprot:Sro764_g199020.1 n/a (367) ;mRNA; f:8885-10118